MKAKPELLRSIEVAAMLRISQPTVTRMVRDGQLRAARVGKQWRINAADVAALLAPAGR